MDTGRMRCCYIVTHAESFHQVQRLTGGWYDTGLTAQGRRQAQQIAEELQERIGGKDVSLFTSDLLRASETARSIADKFQLEPTVLPQLRELRHGVADGRARSWLQQHKNPRLLNGDPLAYQICEGAEFLRECAERIYGAMAVMCQAEEQQLIVVSHSFVLTYLVMAWLQVPISALGDFQLVAKPASLTLLSADESGQRQLVYLSRTDFLSGPDKL